MALRSLLGRLAQDPAGARLLDEGGRAFVSSAMRPYAIAAVLDASPERPGLVVAGDDREAQELADDLAAWLAPRPVLFYPSRGVAYESHLSPPPHLVGLRVAALDALLEAGPDDAPVVVASAVALSEKLPDPALRPRSFTLARGGLIDLDEVAHALVEAGYRRAEEVTERGQFAIRGGILDCFPATGEHPVRVDCFDIEIESIREFSVFTQRSLQEVEEVTIAPAAELSAEYREEAEIATVVDAEDRPDISELLPVERFVAPLELVGPEAKVVVAAEEELAPALDDHWRDVCASIHDEDARHLYLSPREVSGAIAARAGESFSSLASGQPVELHAQAADFAARSVAAAEPELETLVRGGYRTVVTFGHRGEGERAAYNLARLGASWAGEEEPQPAPGEGSLSFAEASLRGGFVAAGARLAVIPEHRLLRRRPARRGAAAGRGRLAAFGELGPGDFVVHEDHGVARLAGFETKTVAGVTRDYLQLEYEGSDRVFLPVDQLTKVSRYVGAGDGEPKLSRLGGKAWETLKARARRAAQDLAGELLNLYADRRRHSGHAFPADSAWQMDFEGRFPYRETVDQAEAIDAVKEDMEAPRPMDRLICGDVGYGKTEVSLRAAFKAADDGRQVLVLAPTTILAQQHYGTFSERLADFPFTVDVVSRLRTAAEQKASVEAFNEGKTDILIGTHRLLGRDLQPKELGLLVVDEEQRFGVRQKELLRQLKLKVDVISMSATPIPRTLQMSLAGVRDISVIETPPEGRRPVRTYVGEYDEELVRTALEREKERGGQAFFLHNRVETIEETAARLRGLCPDLTFAVAHGQLDDGDLEDRMMAFLRGDVDVLVATSIIESGIDIPQANTLIVERADLFGLSQLYQIRGRVGRSRQRAYAYLLYPSAAALSEEATRRLSALSDYTELGAGFKIAMRDLEIRGAGNLLGDEQSGHVAALGFELYLSMLDDAVREAGPAGAGEPREPVRVEVDVDVFIPADYVPFEQARIDIHRRVAAAAEPADLALLADELEDRFGPPPQPVLNLLALQEARVRFGQAGVRSVGLRGGRLTAAPVALEEEAAAALARELPAARYEPGRSLLTLEAGDDPAEQLVQVRGLAGLLASLAPAGAPDGA